MSDEPRCPDGCASPAALAKEAGQAPRVGDSQRERDATYSRCAACYGCVCSQCGRAPVGYPGEVCDPCDDDIAAMGGQNDGA